MSHGATVTIHWLSACLCEGKCQEVVADVPTARGLVRQRAAMFGWHVLDAVQGESVVFTENGHAVARAYVRDRLDEPALAPSQAEAVELIAEECAEVVQCATKVLRFGLRTNPWTGIENGDALAAEIGDVLAVLALLERQGIVDLAKVSAARDRKLRAWVEEPGRLRYASARGIK